MMEGLYIILYIYENVYIPPCTQNEMFKILSKKYLLAGRYFRQDRFVKKILVLLGLHLQNVKMYLSF